MKNQGKIFEQDFRASLNLDSPDLFFYRFKDGTASWGNVQNDFTRFQAKNICDCMLFYKGYLFLCELKSHKGKSLPFSCIRKNQFDEMYHASFKKNVFPLIIIFFSDLEEVYAIKTTDIIRFKDEKKSKSISLSFASQNGFKIDCRKLQTHHRFSVEEFLENFIESQKKEGV